MNSPAWQAIVPEVIPRAQLPDAVSLTRPGSTWPAPWACLGGLMVALFALATTVRVFLLIPSPLSGSFGLYRWHVSRVQSALAVRAIQIGRRDRLRSLRPMLQAAFVGRSSSTLFVSVWALPGGRARTICGRRDGVRDS